MQKRKLILATMAISLLDHCLVYSADYDRRQRIQTSRMLSKKQKIDDRQNRRMPRGSSIKHNTYGYMPHTTSGAWKSPKTLPQFMLFCLLTTCAIQGVVGDTIKTPSTSRPPHLNSGSPSSSAIQQHCVNGECTNSVLPASTPQSLSDSQPFATSQLAQQTASALAAIYCESTKDCIKVLDNTVTFTGRAEECQKFVDTLNDYGQLRKKVIPASVSFAQATVHPAPHFDDWTQAQDAIGINPESVRNVAYKELNCREDRENVHAQQHLSKALCDDSQQNKSIVLKYETAPDGSKSFNQLTADAFIERLKKQSPFFAYVTSQNKNIIYYKNGYVVIDYAALEPYLAAIKPKINAGSNGECSVTLELQTHLKRIMASSGGPISLEATSNPKEFLVRTATLGDTLTLSEKKMNPPILEVIIDKSDSMANEPINIINRKIPVLLRNIQEQLGENDIFNIRIFELNHNFNSHSTFSITAHSEQPTWHEIKADGMTNLKPIGRKMKHEDQENSNRVLIAFTDGDHTVGGPIDNTYYDELKRIRESGKFSQLYLCRFGAARTSSNHFFEKLSEIFKGSSSVESDAQRCIDQLTKAIPSLLKERKPLILAVNEKNDVYWIEADSPSLQTLSNPVQQNDIIKFDGVEAVVQTPETKEERIARLQSEIQKLQASN